MLHPIEILPSARRIVRRGIRLGCELTTNLHGPRREMLVDLSPAGARVLTRVPVARGDEVLLGFATEGSADRIETIARVSHVEPGPIVPAVGLEFVGLEEEVRRDLTRRLRGVPPPLPIAKPKRELVWVDVLVTWSEDLGDRVNHWAVSEKLAAIDDAEIDVQPLADLVTGSAGRYVWKH